MPLSHTHTTLTHTTLTHTCDANMYLRYTHVFMFLGPNSSFLSPCFFSSCLSASSIFVALFLHLIASLSLHLITHTDKVSTNIRCTTTHSLRVHTSLFAHIRFVLFAFIFISFTFVIPFPSSPSLQLPHNPKTEERLAKKSRFQRKNSALRNTLPYLTRL